MRNGHDDGRALLAGMRLALAALLVLMPLAAGAVEPGSELAQQIQAEQRAKLERTVYEASRVIESGEMQGKELAEAFRARGIARSRLLQYAEAAQDFTRAIELYQVDPQYYEDRAIIYLKLGEYKAASRDLDMALGLENKRSSSFREKGRLAFYQGDFALAAREFQRALETAKGEGIIYSAIWLHLAIARGALAGEAPLAPILAQIDASRWPAPVLQMYTGAIEPQEALAAAVSRDPREDLLLKCEAYFYAGQQYLIRGDKDQARAAFEMALATGATEFLEYDWSRRELDLLAAGK
jgi:lipoprotein NlpI